MSNTADYFTNVVKTPKIYVYDTPGTKAKGYLKIGYTTREDVTVRIEEQVANIIMPCKEYTLLHTETAEYSYKSNSFFNDKTIHNALKEKGFKPYKEDYTDSEWFQCSLDDVKTTIFEIKNNLKISTNRRLVYGLRPEQNEAINTTFNYFVNFHKTQHKKSPHFLWNAKMRFGKTFTAYKLIEKMQWTKVLILTYKPAVQSSWQNDLNNHIDFEGWDFITSKAQFSIPLSDKPSIYFSSFQDILGDKKQKNKFKSFYNMEWDCIILDEYHYGSWRDNAKDLYDFPEKFIEYDSIDIEGRFLKSKHYLYLSGTPFKSLSNGEFTEDQIFSWTYSDEQLAKKNWSDKNNPYAELPQLIMMTYKIPSYIEDSLQKGDTEELDEFDLNEFFKAEGDLENSVFIHKESVYKWLCMITGKNFKFEIDIKKEHKKERPPLPFSDLRLLNYLKHTIWFLPNVSSCFAMSNLLKQSDYFNDYRIIIAAGNKAGMGVDALTPVLDTIYISNPQDTKSITLTCGKLTTGVSVAPWTGIFMLRNLSSPESYFQAAFRVQTPWTLKDPITGETEILKEKCYVFDFAPNRALRLIADYCSRLDTHNTKLETKLNNFIGFLPILEFNGYGMKPLDATKILDIVVTGTSSTMLARKFQSPQLINLNNFALEKLLSNEKLIHELNKIEAFRKLNHKLEIIISTEKLLKQKKINDNKLSQKEKEIEKHNSNTRKELRDLLLKFITRIPVFMYLTDHREETVYDLITQIETDLFTKTTGITINTFEELCKINIFNTQNLTPAILAFRLYEESSLNYLNERNYLPQQISGWSGNFPRKESEELIKESNLF